MNNEKIVLTEELLNELSSLMMSGANMEKKGREIRIRAENILCSFATYGVEIPNKRNAKLLKRLGRSAAWIPSN
tara:strand:- start:1133 stop:1354 length:222 start_codon:yes stop_codon:yes gene_type:complete